MQKLYALFAALVLLTACTEDPGMGDTGRDATGASDVRTNAGDATSDVSSFDVPTNNSDVMSIDVPSGTDDASTDGGPNCGMAVGAAPYSEHMMNEEFTDPPVCAGCPDPFTDLNELDGPALPPDATSLSVTGAARGSTECHWYVSNSSCGNTGGLIPVDPEGTGRFATTIPVFCGTNIVRLVCRNDRGTRVFVRRLEGTRCTGRDLRVTLSWDMPGKDLELHLLRAPRSLNSMTEDCTWFTCMSASGLEWGVAGDMTDNPRKDIDNTGSFGPENIFLDRAPAGTYHVVVEHWSRSGDPSATDVDIIVRERSVARLHRDNFARQAVWYVGTVTFPEGRFTPVDSLTDCTASWMLMSRGCDLPLP